MLLKPGEESHSYEPTPQDIIAIQDCDIFIYTGGENDVWVEDILSSIPDNGRLTLRLTDCVETVKEEHVEGMKESGGHEHEEDASDADHEEEPESVHEIDEHVWTSPVNASAITEEICRLLCRADPENSRGMRKMPPLIRKNWPDWTDSSGMWYPMQSVMCSSSGTVSRSGICRRIRS